MQLQGEWNIMKEQAFEEKTVKELRALARKLGISGSSRLRKAELLQRIGQARAERPRSSGAPKTRIRRGKVGSDPKPARMVASVLEEKQRPAGPAPAVMPESVPSFEEEAKLAPQERFPSPEPVRQSRAVLLIQDPHWLHAYWEIDAALLEEARHALGEEWEGSRRVLRIVDYGPASGNGEPRRHDRPVEEFWQNLYFESQPDHAYQVTLGYLAPSGRFFALAASNRVQTPRAGMSDVIDPKWRTLRSERDYEQLYALSGGFRVGAGSLELREQLERFLEQAVTSGSGGISSFGSQFGAEQARPRGFWFKLDCELIVYGATEPNATVTVQGQPVQLRPDGSFTLRFALPDGEQVLEATARSADGREERTITPTVTRKTEVREPVVSGVERR